MNPKITLLVPLTPVSTGALLDFMRRLDTSDLWDDARGEAGYLCEGGNLLRRETSAWLEVLEAQPHLPSLVRQKREIATAVQAILRATYHPELPEGEIQFQLRVEGAENW